MDTTGEERIPASREAVWHGLNDPDILRRCIPGCQSLEMKSPTELAAIVKVKIGPVSATFKGNVTLSNLSPPASYTISGEGTGGIAGFAKGAPMSRSTETMRRRCCVTTSRPKSAARSPSLARV